jgi:ribosome maturation factor RimP
MGKNKRVKNKITDKVVVGKLLSESTREMLAEKISEFAILLCEDENVELVHVEFVVDGYLNVLRVYIDKPGGVSMADCSNISRQLGDIIDVSLTIGAEYRLEVSSPGIYRQLYKKDDYVKFCGRAIKIQTNTLVDGKKKLSGILESISEQGIVEIAVDGSLLKLDYSSITKARLTEDNGDSRC